MTDKRRFYEAPAPGALRSAPAALRNREPIGDVLEDWLPKSGLVLEIASGTGEHAAYFAERFPALDWQPTDIHPDALGSISARVDQAGFPNLLAPIELDASGDEWPIARADAVLSINMVHISPWASALGLIDGAAHLLVGDAPLILYGPWLKDDIETVPSNLEFDTTLKSRDPSWGLRRVEDFAEAAANRGFRLAEARAMPANNLMLRFDRADA